MQWLGRKLTRPASHVIGTPLAAATAEDLHAIAEARLPIAGIDPGMSLPAACIDACTSYMRHASSS